VIGIEDIRAAARRLDGVADRTPVVMSRLLDELVGARVSLKAESLQRTGAYNRIASITAAQRQTGVAFSSGNHAQAVALAARLLGTSSTLVMPADTPSTNLPVTLRYGAAVITHDRYSDD
jgi:threonine dehydratase